MNFGWRHFLCLSLYLIKLILNIEKVMRLEPILNTNKECDIMNINLMDRKMLKVLCAKSVGMGLGDNLHRDRYLVAFDK